LDLVEVGARGGVDEAVEDHAGLHGGEGVEVFDVVGGADEVVEGGLVEVG
jgi:hypothetical protein